MLVYFYPSRGVRAGLSIQFRGPPPPTPASELAKPRESKKRENDHKGTSVRRKCRDLELLSTCFEWLPRDGQPLPGHPTFALTPPPPDPAHPTHTTPPTPP